ncbi:lysine exporter LysO family protein [Acetobacteroides hydrogenigenes]|uniref:Lysine exporter LysO-like protein n=1 Tax=Acetobacteroides hydrogenigenes TaxID=979970 RepID=A0A4R2F1K8_9BACT|nr:lysine exporter LysO family protein [Acetobacteroides hydrogenigenes]TCN73235.1 lysine exporter LysO-like protein [Acetobacteroides hydrogenigenes]
MKGSAIVLSVFVVGMLLAYFGVLPAIMAQYDLSTIALYFLMFMVGVSIGADEHVVAILRSVSFKIVLVPIGVVVGTTIGALLVSFIVKGIDTKNVLAIGSGFGYYSLSSIFIGKISGNQMGVVALLANMIRELSTLMLAPLYVRLFGRLAPVAAAGATSMDTCLPVIMRYSGKEVAIIALFSGIALTIVVPFLVVFILSL